jgi:hypothetical protein
VFRREASGDPYNAANHLDIAFTVRIAFSSDMSASPRVEAGFARLSAARFRLGIMSTTPSEGDKLILFTSLCTAGAFLASFLITLPSDAAHRAGNL